MSDCIHEGCDRPAEARGMCNTHYMRQRRAGLLPIGTRATASVEERFWRFVKKTPGCWEWTGRSKSKKGYGQIGSGGKGGAHVLVHRLSYTIHRGPIPEGMVVMHLCDNPSCVNPAHLKAGTQSENIKHAVESGRKALPDLPVFHGTEHHMAKIDENAVRDIRASGKKTSALAEEYGLSYSSIQRIRKRLLWKHVP